MYLRHVKQEREKPPTMLPILFRNETKMESKATVKIFYYK